LKTLSLEEIYVDPHKLDSFLISGESVAVLRDGQAVAEFVPHKNAVTTEVGSVRPKVDFRARFMGMWGPEAFNSTISVSAEFEEFRRQREL